MTLIQPVEIEIASPNHSQATPIFQPLLASATQKPVENRSLSFWTVFSSTFLTIFLAEMGDKTQLATLLMSAQSQSPWVVFAGAAAALISTSLLGVLIGYWIAKRLSPQTLNLAVAMLLLLITGFLVADVITG